MFYKYIINPFIVINICFGTIANSVYKARYANITIYEIVFMTMKLIYSCVDNAIFIILSSSSFTYLLMDLINTFLAYFVLYAFVWRFWCISYEINWTKYLMDNQWKSIINQDHTTVTSYPTNRKSTWYLSHKNTFGNYKWIKWRIFIIAICSSSAHVVGKLYGAKAYGAEKNVYLSQIWSSWPYTLPLICLIIIYCLTPSFLDHFYIQKEMRYIFILLCIDYITYYITLVGAALMVNTWSDIAINIMFSVEAQIVVGCQFGAVMIATYWVNTKMNKIISKDRYKTTKIQIFHTISSSKSLLDDNDGECVHVSDGSLKLELIEIEPKSVKRKTQEYISNISKPLLAFLSNSVAFESFMIYLSHEFSMENLLSFVEFLQFQKYVADKMDPKRGSSEINGTKKPLLCDMIQLPDTVPLSEIVYDESLGIKKKAYLLYKKYICDESVYMINISFRVKQKVSKIMKQYKMDIEFEYENVDKDIMMVFDECSQEMRQIMLDSYSRYKSTPQYHNIVSNILFVE